LCAERKKGLRRLILCPTHNSMVRLPALVEAFASCDERDRASIAQFARVIREAGLLPTTKRGRGAARMGALEAAILMIGLNAAGTPSGAPAAIRGYQNARALPPNAKDYQPLNYLSKHSFPLALAALLGDMPSLVAKLSRDLLHLGITKSEIENTFAQPSWIEVSLHRPAIFGSIKLKFWEERKINSDVPTFGMIWRPRTARDAENAAWWPVGQFRSTTVTLTARTIFCISYCLNAEMWNRHSVDWDWPEILRRG
jgi:hypothetical protein